MKGIQTSMNRLAIITSTAVALQLGGTMLLTAPLSAGMSSEGGAIRVEIAQESGRNILLRGGEPYEIKGAGIETGDIERLAAHGGTSFRNWSTVDGLRVLDEAAKYGLTVAMCISIGRERLGFDYDDPESVARQLEYARKEVLKYKDHPALLMWIIGNEPDYGFSNPRVFDAINDISKMIHEVDGKHPTTTALTFNIDQGVPQLIKERAPDLDIISVQKYADIVNVPRYIEEAGIFRPYLVTEWGPVGHWEVEKTSWGAPIESSSSEKAAYYLEVYRSAIAPHSDRIIGSYTFLWGQKQERTPTWYSMFLEDGTETEVVDVMHYLWNGSWPENRSPRIKALHLDSKTPGQEVILKPGASYQASIVATDPDGDPLEYRWSIMHESEARQEGGDREQIPETRSGLIENAGDGEINVRAPVEAGAYRLFVYIYDGQGHAAHANVPFLVK